MRGQFFRFVVVGVIGFLFDTATVYALRGPLGLIGAGMAAYFVAASVNWALNRNWTFRGLGNGARHRQWLRYLVANGVGFVLNRGTYSALVTLFAVCSAQPVLAVAAGALAGLSVNFTLSRRVVFR